MSWQIPTQIEQDIIAGKAKYQTFQTGNGGQSILPVPPNSYVVIFGYDFSPAGGGFKRMRIASGGDINQINDTNIRYFETQQLSFYTGTDFYPFIHHCDVKTQVTPYRTNEVPPESFVQLVYFTEEIDNSPIARQVYITSTNDVTITHGLILTTRRASANPIPITNRTPQALTYGGSGQTINTQTNYGPIGTPQQFMQPSPKDYQDFAFGLLPANADGQAFATPDVVEGLLDVTDFANGALGSAIRDSAALQYYLCLHYAIYSKTIPEQRG
jgi:hypothetical protein